MVKREKRPRPEGWTGAWTPYGPIESKDPEAVWGPIAAAAALRDTMREDREEALKDAAALGLTKLPDPEDDDAWDEIEELYRRHFYPEYYEDFPEDGK